MKPLRLKEIFTQELDNEKPYKIFFLSGIKMEAIDNSNDPKLKNTFQKFSIILSHNKQYQLFYCSSKESFEEWKRNFQKSCVNVQYNKNYESIKVIGNGSKAKVVLSKRKRDDKEFAVKTYEKEKIDNLDNPERTKVLASFN